MDQREFALSSALRLAEVNGGLATANAPHSVNEVAGNATVFLSFLEGNYKHVLAGAAAPEGAPPKATRQKKAAANPATDAGAYGAGSASQDATSAAEASSGETQKTAPASGAAKDDMFGEDEKAAETKKSETKKTEIKKEIKKTLDDVRAALVAAQTALKSKDKAIAILTEVAGAGVLSKLKEEDFGKLIDKCNAAVKAAA